MSPGNIETEIKFRIENENRILEKLKNIGAKKVAEGLEHNEVFDNGVIRENGILLRLRKFGNKNTITFKSGIAKDVFKKATEIEIDVNSFENAKKIIRGLGFEVFWIYEKGRAKFMLGGTEISVDRLPFGTFLEIEGPEEEIRDIVKMLELKLEEGTTDTYLETYQNYCKEQGEEMENLVFWKKCR